MTQRTKGIISISLLAVFTLIGVGAVVKKKNGNVVEVRLEAVKERDLTSVVSASGWIRPHKKVDVQADVMGRIVELRVKEGDHVNKGDLLLRIDPTQYEAQVARAEAAVSEAKAREAQARANVIQAQRAYDRNLKLSTSDQNLISKQAVEDAETQLQVQKEMLSGAQYSVQQAIASLQEARTQLEKTVIRSPMTGVVTRKNVEEGETAIIGTMNNAGSLLLTVADLSVMEAVIRVDETDVPQIKLGDSATVEIDAFPKQKFMGRVTEIAHSSTRNPDQQQQVGGASQQSVDYNIIIQLQNPPTTLRSDLSATAEVTTAARQHVLSIPIIALTVREKGNVTALPTESKDAEKAGKDAERDKTDDQEGVFILKDGKAHFVQVKTGITGREHFEVLAGLTAKDTVVAGPYDAIRTLEEGKPLKPIQDAAKGKKAEEKK